MMSYFIHFFVVIHQEFGKPGIQKGWDFALQNITGCKPVWFSQDFRLVPVASVHVPFFTAMQLLHRFS